MALAVLEMWNGGGGRDFGRRHDCLISLGNPRGLLTLHTQLPAKTVSPPAERRSSTAVARACHGPWLRASDRHCAETRAARHLPGQPGRPQRAQQRRRGLRIAISDVARGPGPSRVIWGALAVAGAASLTSTGRCCANHPAAARFRSRSPPRSAAPRPRRRGAHRQPAPGTRPPRLVR